MQGLVAARSGKRRANHPVECVKGMVLLNHHLILDFCGQRLVEHLFPGRLDENIGIDRVNKCPVCLRQKLLHLLLILEMRLCHCRRFVQIGVLEVGFQIVGNAVQILCRCRFRRRFRLCWRYFLRRLRKVEETHPVVAEQEIMICQDQIVTALLPRPPCAVFQCPDIVSFGNIHQHGAAGMCREADILNAHRSSGQRLHFPVPPAHELHLLLEFQRLIRPVHHLYGNDPVPKIGSFQGQIVPVKPRKQRPGAGRQQKRAERRRQQQICCFLRRYPAFYIQIHTGFFFKCLPDIT